MKDIKSALLQEKLFYFAYLAMGKKLGKITDEQEKEAQVRFVEELKDIERRHESGERVFE